MLYALKDYIRRAFHFWWLLLMELIFGGFGVYGLVSGNQILIPTWGWWTIVALSLFASQFWAFWSLYKEQSGKPSTNPNFPFSELIKRAIGTRQETTIDGGMQKWFTEAQQVAIYKLQTEIRERAIQGHIQVWGRKNAETLKEDQPRTLIPTDFWETGDFGMLSTTLGDQKGHVERTLPDKTKIRYWDLSFARHQIVTLWPSPRIGLTLKNPFKLTRRFWYEQ